jgi:hypothetical protein
MKTALADNKQGTSQKDEKRSQAKPEEKQLQGEMENPFLANSQAAGNPFLPNTIQKKTNADKDIQQTLSTSSAEQVAQRKDATLPEKLGTPQSGPIAQKGGGDANAFSPNDVNQGSIGDCYFLASLVALANANPNAIKNAIKDNKNGTFTVKLYTVTEEKRFLFGKKKVFTPTDVVLYPTFPISVDGNDAANPDAAANPAHAHGGDQDAKGNTELWVRLVEKAYALMMGSYKTIGNGGFGADALEVLTGKPYKEEVLDGSYKKRIISMYKEKIPVEVATHKDTIAALSGDLKTFARDNSIVGGHSYAVMFADDSKIRVRNPWGSGARNAEPEMTWAQFGALFNQYSNQG